MEPDEDVSPRLNVVASPAGMPRGRNTLPERRGDKGRVSRFVLCVGLDWEGGEC